MKISYSFILLMCFLYFIDTSGVFIYFLIASFIHELGHIFAILICKGKISSFTLSAIGANMDYNFSKIKSYKVEIFITINGILFNFIFALLFAYLGFDTLSGASILLGIFNSLPVLPLDGGIVLQNIISCISNPYKSDKILHVISIIVAVLLCILGVFVLIISNYNISILLIGIFMLVRLLK